MTETSELEKHYYSHKYANFDSLCKTKEEVIDCIRMYISKDMSTADFEATKYIVFHKYFYLEYILKNFTIKDWIGLLATAIFNKAHPAAIKLILDYHLIKTKNLLEIDPLKDDIMWLCLDTGSLHVAVIMNSVCDIKNIDLACSPEMKWNYKDPSNPRNLVYAIKQERIQDAMELINNGCEVDIWNNFNIAMCFASSVLKTKSDLIKALFERGAKVPKYVQLFVSYGKQKTIESISQSYDRHISPSSVQDPVMKVSSSNEIIFKI